MLVFWFFSFVASASACGSAAALCWVSRSRLLVLLPAALVRSPAIWHFHVQSERGGRAVKGEAHGQCIQQAAQSQGPLYQLRAATGRTYEYAVSANGVKSEARGQCIQQAAQLQGPLYQLHAAAHSS